VVRRATAKRIARLSVEAAVLLLAVGAAVALLSRGLAEQSAGFGVDPLAAAGPLAIAAVATVIMVRACVILLPLAAAAALRVRGVAVPIVASRLGRRIEVVPLAAVTIAVALVVGTGVLSSTVRAGQVDAAWLAVGADVRVDGGVDSDTVDSVAQEDGVTAASGYSARSGQLEVASNTARVTVIAVDAGYPALLEALPDIEGLPDADVATAFRGLVGTTVGPLPAIVDSGSAARLVEDETVVTIGDDDVRVRIIGTVPTQPGVEGSSVYVDVDALADRVSVSVGVDSLVAIGLGAGAAVASIDSDGGTVLTREGWVDDRRRSALISGVDRGMSAGTVILAVLALLAVVSFALAGSANRARTIALLRTLGVRPRFGVLLSLVDQLPLLAASLVGGILAGVGAAALFLPALGLEFLTGGRSAPPLSIPPEVIGLACGGILVVFVLGTLIEVVLRRRDRVSDTIRVGGAS
jgi:putative ABC transport system permease protein